MARWRIAYDEEIEAETPERACEILAAIMRQKIITSWRVTGTGRGSGRGSVFVQLVDGKGQVIA
jgi:hypothetical protein